MELGSSIKLLCHRSPSAQLSDGLRAAAQCHLAPMCTTLPAMLADLPIPWQQHHQLGSIVEVLRWHPHFSIHLGGAIEASCRCAASYCLLSCRSSPSAHLSDGFPAAVLPAAALATAALNVSSWLWTCRMTWVNQCHLEALKRPTNLKRWILQNGMALTNYEHTTHCCPAHRCTACRLLCELPYPWHQQCHLSSIYRGCLKQPLQRFTAAPLLLNSMGGGTETMLWAAHYCTKACHLWDIMVVQSLRLPQFSLVARSSQGSGKSL